MLTWQAEDAATGNILQTGIAAVQEDSLVVIPQIIVYREAIRKVRITTTDPLVGTAAPATGPFNLVIAPNPSSDEATLYIKAETSETAEIEAISTNGQIAVFRTMLHGGNNRLALSPFRDLPAGFYTIAVRMKGRRDWIKWLKL